MHNIHVQAKIGNYRWRICALLFFATTINYIDRQVLGILAPQLQAELGWSDSHHELALNRQGMTKSRGRLPRVQKGWMLRAA